MIFYIICSAPLTWKATDQVMNTLLYMLQKNKAFLQIVVSDIARLFKLKAGPSSINDDPFRENPFESVFDLQITDEFMKEIDPHLSKLKNLSLEYLYKAFKLIINFNENFAENRVDKIRCNIYQISDHLLSATKNKETLKNYLDIIKEIGYNQFFYKDYNQMAEVENLIEQYVGKETDDSRLASFSHHSKDLSQVFDAEKEKADNIDNDELSQDVKLYFEKILISGEYNMSKNEKISKFLVKNKENFNIIKIFLTMPLVYEVSSTFKTFCQSKELKTIDDIPNEMTNNQKEEAVSNLKNKNQSTSISKLQESDRRNEFLYYRAYLTNMLLMTEDNHELLFNTKPDYIEQLIEAFYEGFKSGQSSLTIALYLFEHLLQKSNSITCGLLFKYNFIFLFLEHLHNPKCFDFLLNFITPGSRIFGFKQELYSNILVYLKCSGFFQDIVDALINPESAKNNIKFDKFFSNSDLKEVFEKVMQVDKENKPSESLYKRITKDYFVAKSKFDSFLCNRVYNIDNRIDFPEQESEQKFNIKGPSPKNNASKVHFNSKQSIEDIKPNDSKIKTSKAEQYRKTKLLSKSQMIKQEDVHYNLLYLDYYYHILTSVVDTSRKKIIRKKTTKVQTAYSNKSQVSLRSSRNDLRNAPTVQPPSKLVLLPADKNAIDGYIGTTKIIDLYPCFNHNGGIKNGLSIEDNEKFFKSLDKKKFDDIEAQSYRYVTFLYELIKDIYSDNKIIANKLNTNNTKNYYLWHCLLDFKQCSLFKDLLQCFLYKIDYVYHTPQPEKTSPIAAGKTVLLILKFIESHPLADKYDNTIKNIFKEHFYMFQEKFFKMYKFYNDKNNLVNHKPINFQFKVLKEPFGMIRKIFCDLFFNIFKMKWTEIEYFDVVDIKLLQICFAWVFDKRHNTYLASIILGCMNNLVQLRTEKFILEITVKLGLFDIVANFLQTIYINETFITSYDVKNTLFFVNEFTRIYIGMIERQAEFPLIYNALTKFETFKYVCKTLYKINGDLSFEVNFIAELNESSARSGANLKEKENSKIQVNNKKKTKHQKYFDEVKI